MIRDSGKDDTSRSCSASSCVFPLPQDWGAYFGFAPLVHGIRISEYCGLEPVDGEYYITKTSCGAQKKVYKAYARSRITDASTRQSTVKKSSVVQKGLSVSKDKSTSTATGLYQVK